MTYGYIPSFSFSFNNNVFVVRCFLYIYNFVHRLFFCSFMWTRLSDLNELIDWLIDVVSNWVKAEQATPTFPDRAYCYFMKYPKVSGRRVEGCTDWTWRSSAVVPTVGVWLALKACGCKPSDCAWHLCVQEKSVSYVNDGNRSVNSQRCRQLKRWSYRTEFSRSRGASMHAWQNASSSALSIALLSKGIIIITLDKY